MNKPGKVLTCTTAIMDVLIRNQALMTAHQLVAATNNPYNRVSAALFSLKQRNAVKLIEVYGGSFWAATPENDTRHHVVIERKVEVAPRKQRKYQTPRIQRNSKKEI